MGRGCIITRTTKDGKKRYRTGIWIDGKQKWRTWAKKKDAENYLDRVSPKVRDGIYQELKTATFGEYLDRWQKLYLVPSKFKASTYNAYRSVIAHHLKPEWGEWQLQAIDAEAIEGFTAKLRATDGCRRKTKLSEKTIRNTLILLGKILTKAASEHYLMESPMLGFELPRKDKSQKGRALKPDEIRDILEETSGTFRTMFLMAVLSGLRRAEQFALDWDYIDFDRNKILVRRVLYWKFGKYQHRGHGERFIFDDPKSDKSNRDVNLAPLLRKELLELSMKTGRTGLVFRTARGTPHNPENIVKRDFADALAAAEAKRKAEGRPPIGKVRWHDLRHTFGSLLLDRTKDIFHVSRQMGHSSITVTCDIYGHEIGDKPESAASIENLIMGTPEVLMPFDAMGKTAIQP